MPILDQDSPVYIGRRLFQHGRWYHFDVDVYIFDCPNCGYARAYNRQEEAETALDMHFFHHHPELYVPLISIPDKAKINAYFAGLRMRSKSPVGKIRDKAS